VQASQRTGILRLFSIIQSLACHPAWACTAIFLLTLVLRTALLPWLPIPKPVIHDEFSYLLAGDTYAHGRLANPPHPFWQHFETFQEMQQPNYASKYQPLQGLVLAFGERFFNQPWIGVLLSTALMCAAVCWMLQGWIAPEWALLGAFLFTLRIGVLSYWMNSYEGGSVPAIGGALAMGAVARIWRGCHGNARFGHAITWAIGISVLMLSRPYDAVVVAISSAGLLLWLQRKSPRLALRVAVPAFIVLSVTLAAIAYNDYRVTGNALSLPYQVNDRQYSVAPMFFLLSLHPEPQYRHAVMRDFWARWNVDLWKDSRAAPVSHSVAKAYIPSDFFFGFWPIALPLLLAPFSLKTTEERICVGVLAACFVSLEALIGVAPHYAAAFSGVFYLRFLQSLKRLSAWKEPFGPLLAAAIPALFVLAFLNSAIGLVAKSARGGDDPIPLVHGYDSFSKVLAERGSRFGAARDAMDRDLAALPGRQLVLVRYQTGHDPQEEWVYNHADIDRSRVVWAREMSPAEDAPFLDYYRDRHVWLAEPDAAPLRLTPYSAAQPAPTTIAMKDAPR
jgi:hypothetical protein